MKQYVTRINTVSDTEPSFNRAQQKPSCTKAAETSTKSAAQWSRKPSDPNSLLKIPVSFCYHFSDIFHFQVKELKCTVLCWDSAVWVTTLYSPKTQKLDGNSSCLLTLAAARPFVWIEKHPIKSEKVLLTSPRIS